MYAGGASGENTLPYDAYAVICQGGTTPVYASTSEGCVLPADLPEHKPSISLLGGSTDVLIYHSVYSGGENFQLLEVTSQFVIILLE